MSGLILTLTAFLTFAMGVLLGQWERRPRQRAAPPEMLELARQARRASLESAPVPMVVPGARGTSENRTNWIH